MKYFIHGIQTSAVNSSTNCYVLRGNSVFDPDVTSAAHVCMGVAQWNAFYGNYIVGGSKVDIKIVNLHATNAVTICLIPAREVFNPATVQTSNLPEQPYCQVKQLTIAAGGMASCTMKGYMSTKKQWGKAQYGGDHNFMAILGNVAQGGTNPVNQWYWNITTSDTGGSTAAGACKVALDVRATYYTKLFYRKALVNADLTSTESSAPITDRGPTGVIPIFD